MHARPTAPRAVSLIAATLLAASGLALLAPATAQAAPAPLQPGCVLDTGTRIVTCTFDYVADRHINNAPEPSPIDASGNREVVLDSDSRPVYQPITLDNSKPNSYYEDGEQTFTVPAGVSGITVQAIGAQGGRQSGSQGSIVGPGGVGAVTSGALAVTSGSTLFVVVGGPGGRGFNDDLRASKIQGYWSGNGYAGYNGGGIGGTGRVGRVENFGGGGGGGASDVRTVSSESADPTASLDSRLVVAAGGGGSAAGNAGQPGGLFAPTRFPNAGGQPGTLTAGGAGGISNSTQGPASSGTSGLGGDGQGGGAGPDNAGGGGGGGLFGGGGGTQGGGGGGGSSLVPAGGTTRTSAGEVPGGYGRVTISYSTNTTPVAVDDALTATPGPGDRAVSVTPAALLANDTDADGDALTLTVTGQPAHGALTQAADGTLTYTPAAGYLGSDGFTYTAGDGFSTSNTATVAITVPDQAPVATADTYATNAAAPALTVAAPGVLANDTDPDAGDTRTAALVTGPTNGTLTLAADGSFSYTPRSGYTGTDTFTYRAVDRAGVTSAPATVTLTVNPASADIGVTVDAPATARRSTSFAVTLTVTNSGPSTATLAASGFTLPAGLTVTSAQGGAVTNDKRTVGFVALSLAPGASRTYTVTVTATSATGNRTITAAAASLTRDPAFGNNTARDTISIT